MEPPAGHHRRVGRPTLSWIDGLTRWWSGLSVAELTAAVIQRSKITPAPATQPRRSERLLRQRADDDD